MALIARPHNSICPGLCPPGVRKVGLINLPCRGGAPRQIHQKVGGMASTLKPHNSITESQSLPRFLHPGPGSRLLSRTHATQGGTTGSPEGSLIASPQANIIWKGMLFPRKMASVVWEMNSVKESWQLSLHLSLSPKLKPQSVLR